MLAQSLVVLNKHAQSLTLLSFLNREGIPLPHQVRTFKDGPCTAWMTNHRVSQRPQKGSSGSHCPCCSTVRCPVSGCGQPLLLCWPRMSHALHPLPPHSWRDTHWLQEKGKGP